MMFTAAEVLRVDEARTFQNLEVLGDRVERHLERRRQIGDVLLLRSAY